MQKNTEKRIILLAANMSVFVTPFLASSLNVALPSIQRSFGCDNLILNWVVTSYLIVIPMFLVPFGRIADSVGHKKIFTSGLCIFVIGSILCGLSDGIYQLISFRVIQATGAAMQFSSAVSLIMDEYSPGERGKALGLNVACVYVGLSMGPVLGGLIVQHMGWRNIFFINAVLCSSLVLLMTGVLGSDFASGDRIRMDIRGTALYCLSIVSVMFGFGILPSPAGIFLIFAGLILGALFLRIEMTTDLPVLQVRLFRKNRIFVFSNLAALINYSATFAIGYLLSLYFQYAREFTPSKAGMLLLVQPLTQALFSPMTGRMSDKFDPGRLASIGMGILAAGLLCLSFLTIQTPLQFIIMLLAFLGFGFALFSSPNINAAMSAVDKEHYGIASSILGTTRLLGQMSSMAIVMLAASIHMGKIKISNENIQRFMETIRTDFVIFAFLCTIGIFFSLVRGKRGNRA